MHKRLSRGGSFGEATDRPTVIWAWLVRNLERLVEELVYHEICTGRVVAWIGYRDGRAGEGHASLTTPTDLFDVLLHAFRPCVRRAWIPRAMAQRMHLFAERLTPKLPSQIGLFEGDGSRAEAVARIKREVNARHGRFAVRSAATLPLASIYHDPSNEWDICDVRGKMCF
jgi:DNA polymerase V